MTNLSNIPVAVVGASRGLGRTLAETFHRHGAQVLVTARGQAGLDALAREVSGIRTLACDAAAAETPEKVFAAQTPRILVLCGGAVPPCRPLPDMDWQTFSTNWDNDVRMSFNFLQAALKRPLPAGTTIVTIASGAALGGSPISGGYAGSKRMQMFLSGYAQKESDRAGLGLRFFSLSPARMMPETDVGKAGVSGYAAYNGSSEADFVAAMGTLLTPRAVAEALVGLIGEAPPGGHFTVSVDGVMAIS